ncbi:alanine/glycine:cation symporter family protein [Bacillus safensis]|uniref:alanine/glycine:cation symporter family protein n=1 Tax=Bacillus safensis TaxID=561879 RepID=UPI00227EB0F0|nr:alanine/glycine:cation symporter family protein [Bacillus safensis]MCY7474167.1 alanine:cation symporter family protein [Bacillus safensis]MCY7508703.1 alanine:cation symporter family protein [Bacillus safensis]MCY7515548.1 alanine:cation symporter family protein [Bacillus safensis]MEC1079702.1 alanine/glycine:cation symporter family protein [Bacillus safensis]MED4708107.1 alanine/glycine:cation symporter family protein [Bacillus safensis]
MNEKALLSYLTHTNDFIWTYIVIALLLGVGVYFTYRTRFLQVRMIKEMLRVLKEGRKEKEGISPFQAFAISMAARVGTGNITGIAIAIAIGGPGAIFWMWIVAIIGSASSFVESTLAQVYKVKDKTGFRGGPAYYMEKGLNKRWMGVLFAILITISFGIVFNSVQSNTITVAFKNSFGLDRLTVGIIMAVIFAAIIFKGIQAIAKASEYIVVVLAVAYIGIAFFVIVTNITELPGVISTIVKHAFGFEQFAGGTLGGALLQGIKRGLFSNEAGMGSAPNAAATAVTSHPVKQGLIQAFGVLTDTLIICTSTAFLVLFSDAYKTTNLQGIELTQASLSQHIGPWASGFLAIMIFLFAFSTLIGNYYYGETNIEFLGANKMWLNVYRVAVIGMVLFGSIAKVDLVWGLADIFMGLMVIVNLIAITMLSKVAFAALKDYTRQKKEGKDPVFYKNAVPNNEKIECWDDEPAALKKNQIG